MCAKQAWRLFAYLNSLIFKLPQAKYFHSEDFMNVTLGTQPSYTWFIVLTR